MKIALRNAPKEVDMDIRRDDKMSIGGMTANVWIFDAPVYDGAYQVIPSANEVQILKTKEKTMVDDVTVEKVPYYETSNTAGGMTCYIAEEV